MDTPWIEAIKLVEQFIQQAQREAERLGVSVARFGDAIEDAKDTLSAEVVLEDILDAEYIEE